MVVILFLFNDAFFLSTLKDGLTESFANMAGTQRRSLAPGCDPTPAWPLV